MMGLGLGILENCYPYYPSVEHRGGAFGSYLAPGMEDMPQIDTIMIENPSADGPYGAKGIGEMANNPQPPAIAAAVLRRDRRLGHGAADHARARAARARGEGEPTREGRGGKKVVFDEELSVNAVSLGAGCRLRGLPPDARRRLQDVERRGSPHPLPGGGDPRDRRRAGDALPRDVRAGHDACARHSHPTRRAGDVDRRRRRDDDGRRRDEDARRRRRRRRQPRGRARALLRGRA